jgi:hypothetical protein
MWVEIHLLTVSFRLLAVAAAPKTARQIPAAVAAACLVQGLQVPAAVRAPALLLLAAKVLVAQAGKMVLVWTPMLAALLVGGPLATATLGPAEIVFLAVQAVGLWVYLG